jgi:cobalt/nickel transport protein
MKRKEIIIGLLVAITLAIFSFLASSSPDGLERIAEDKNFLETARVVMNSPIPDYLFPGINNERIAGSLAGISGVLIVFALGFGIAKLLENK